MAFQLSNEKDDIYPVTIGEFQNITYDNINMGFINPLDKAYELRAMYFRFVACCVRPDNVVQALDEWQKVTKGLQPRCTTYTTPGARKAPNALDEILKAQWENLKAYALSFSKGLSAEQAEQRQLASATSIIPEGFINQKNEQLEKERKHYPLSHLKALLSKLTLQPDVKKEIDLSVQRMNKWMEKYHILNENDIFEKLKSIRNLPTLEERLALMREFHFRTTANRSETGQGEWMRLEQVVSILIAMKQDSLLQIDTSEGKTLILQMIAILHALDRKKVTVLTHNESLALEAGNKIHYIAGALGLKIAKKRHSAQDILDADIFYTDISDAVINDLLAKQQGDPTITMSGNRAKEVAIVDEVDNVVIDIHGMTTMQISAGIAEAELAFEAFLMALNDVVRNQLSQMATIADQSAQRQFIRNILEQSLTNNDFYQNHCKEDAKLDQFIAAAVSAMGLVKDKDYIVEQDDQSKDLRRRVIHIVHKDTTGRVDKISQWGNYIHQCVAAWEKAQEALTAQQKKQAMPAAKMTIPGITEILESGDVVSYLEKYHSRMGVSGTLGNEAIKSEIETAIQSKQTVIMPRAQRVLDKQIYWPLKVTPETRDLEGKVGETDELGNPIGPQLEIEYNRIYWFPPVIAPSKTKHFEALAEAILNIQASGQSCILFLNTIDECNEFYNYLAKEDRDQAVELKCDISMVQILDDTQGETANARALRPPESTIIDRARTQGMITLTTAAGSRGTDFSNVDVGILAKPSLGRVTLQKAGRIGRNGELGLIYEIYNEQDFLTHHPQRTLSAGLEQKAAAEQAAATTVHTADSKKHFSFQGFFGHLFKLNVAKPPKMRNLREHHRFYVQPFEEEQEDKMKRQVSRKAGRRH